MSSCLESDPRIYKKTSYKCSRLQFGGFFSKLLDPKRLCRPEVSGGRHRMHDQEGNHAG